MPEFHGLAYIVMLSGIIGGLPSTYVFAQKMVLRRHVKKAIVDLQNSIQNVKDTMQSTFPLKINIASGTGSRHSDYLLKWHKQMGIDITFVDQLPVRYPSQPEKF